MKSALGVIAGFVDWTILWLAGGFAIIAAFPGAIDDDGAITGRGALLASLALSVVCSVSAGTLCRVIGGPGKATPVLAGLLLVVGLVVQIAGWDAMPVWYHGAFLLLLVPMTMLGGSLGARMRRKATAS
jgi:hypothetical protein